MDNRLAILERPGASDSEPASQDAVPRSVADRSVCFPRGTRIATLDGDCAVETLSGGELLYNVTGEAVRVRHVGWHASTQARSDAKPVRVHSGAIASGAPLRDLVLRANHAIHVNGTRVPIALLVDGRSIVWEPVPALSFWDLELEHEAVLLVENLPVASRLHHAADASRLAPIVETVKGHIRQPARTAQSDPPLLVVGGRMIRGVVDGQGRHVFPLPSHGDIRIANCTTDSIGRLLLQDELGAREVPLDDPALSCGRETATQLPRHYLEGTTGAVQLVVAQRQTA